MAAFLRILFALAFASGVSLARADVTIVEYRHSGFDHYFITPVAAEIALLDAKVPPFELWSRTGFTFRAYDSKAAPAGSVPTCRFFNSSFAPKSSHFYAPKGLGCETTLANYPDWLLEDDQLFATMLPDAAGACPGGTVPVYRLYNGGQGGAPNHRFVTSLAERQKMLDKGYIAEGSGIGVGMCVPPTVFGRTTAEGYWRGTSDRAQDINLVILDDGKYFALYSAAGSPNPLGAMYGIGTYINGNFTSTNGVDVPFAGQPFLGGAVPLVGKYVAGSSMQLTIGASSASASYDPSYDVPATVASLAGDYAGSSGHYGVTYPVTATIDAQGKLLMLGNECDIAGTATPRGSTSVFDLVVVTQRGPCFGGVGRTGQGILTYDPAIRRIQALVPLVFEGRYDSWFLFATKK